VYKTVAVISAKPSLAAAYGVFFSVHGLNKLFIKSEKK